MGMICPLWLSDMKSSRNELASKPLHYHSKSDAVIASIVVQQVRRHAGRMDISCLWFLRALTGLKSPETLRLPANDVRMFVSVDSVMPIVRCCQWQSKQCTENRHLPHMQVSDATKIWTLMIRGTDSNSCWVSLSMSLSANTHRF